MLRIARPFVGPAFLLCAIALVGAVFAGCGGDNTEQADSEESVALEERATREEAHEEREEQGREAEVEQEEREVEERQPSTAGTITGTGEGTSVRNTYRLGPLLYPDEGTPPEAALSACLIGGSAAISSSVFAEGELEIEYVDGTLALPIYLSNELVQAEGLQATLAAQEIDGEWLCAIEDVLGRYLELQPGETQTIPFWVVDPGTLSNAQPKLPEEVKNSWYFDFVGPVGNTTELEVQGPGRVLCEEEFSEEVRLMLYNRANSSPC